MDDWRDEIERERFTVPSAPRADACMQGPTLTYARGQRECSKRRFLSEQVAINFGRLLEIRYQDGVTRDAYECDVCEPGTWHVTRNKHDE